MRGCRTRASGSGRPGRTGSSTTPTTSSRIFDEQPLQSGPERFPGRGLLDLELADRLAERGFGGDVGGMAEESQVILLALVGVAKSPEGLLNALEDGPALGLGDETVEREGPVLVGGQSGLVSLPDRVRRGRPLDREELVIVPVLDLLQHEASGRRISGGVRRLNSIEEASSSDICRMALAAAAFRWWG